MQRCYRLAFTILLLLPITASFAKETVITIDNTTKTVSKMSDCKKGKWNDSAKDACICCLSQQEEETQNPDKAINECIREKHCTTDLIDRLVAQEEGVTTKQELVTKLYDKTVAIKQVNFDYSSLTKEGKFSEEALARFLEYAYKTNKLSDPHFARTNCLKVRDLSKSAGATGVNTLQLFLVTSECQPEKAVYIIKQMGKGAMETKRLEVIYNTPHMKELIAPHHLPGFPIVALPSAYLSYSAHARPKFLKDPLGHFKDATNYLAIMPAAQGIPLGDIVLQYHKNPSKENEEIIRKAYDDIGIQLANFYKRFMPPHQQNDLIKTVIHGDLHPFNLFYDLKTGQVTFIDAESMEKAIKKPQPIYLDLMNLLYVPLTGLTTTEVGESWSGMLPNINKKKWVELSFISFIRGFLSTYPPNVRAHIFTELSAMLTGVVTKIPFSLEHIFLRPALTLKLIKKYVEPALKAFAKEMQYE